MAITLDGTEGIQIPDGKTLGSTSDSDSITIAAGGVTKIAFAATQSASSGANVLDDYEEGTYTPALTFGGGSTGIAYGTQEGIYTKIGRICYVGGRVTLTNKGSSSGDAVMTIPFTTAASANAGQANLAYGTNFSTYTAAGVTFAAAQGAATVMIYGIDNGSSLTNSHFNNNTDFIFTLTYMTA
tara:strand:- start:182 stop:733 length:552 start_codon:yes stop_codon:yes gene_type:complete